MHIITRLLIAPLLMVMLCNCNVNQSIKKRTPPLLDPSGSALPITQIVFRNAQLQKVHHYLRDALYASINSYNEEPLYGWSKISINRPSIGSREASTVYIYKINHDAQLIEIAIRGTANIDDAYIDIQASKELDSMTGTSFHSGFKLIANIVYKSIIDKFGNEIKQGYMIRLYGHSLGGAVASIVSMYLYESGATIEFVGTFGAPRFTNNEGARKYQLLNVVTYRVVRCDDAIPFMPPPKIIGWSNGSYEANGNIILLMHPPFFDYSERMDIERDFTYQLRLELENASSRKKMAYGHRVENYERLLTGLFSSEPTPKFYTLAEQASFCNADI